MTVGKRAEMNDASNSVPKLLPLLYANFARGILKRYYNVITIIKNNKYQLDALALLALLLTFIQQSILCMVLTLLAMANQWINQKKKKKKKSTKQQGDDEDNEKEVCAQLYYIVCHKREREKKK